MGVVRELRVIIDYRYRERVWIMGLEWWARVLCSGMEIFYDAGFRMGSGRGRRSLNLFPRLIRLWF